MSAADKIIKFYNNLQPPKNLPGGIEVLFPQEHAGVKKIIKTFYSKYYSSNKKRGLLFGINPGRFGAGITGINFTAPKQLTEYCNIENRFKQSSELSAEFIYEMIAAYGGPSKFYGNWYIAPVCPLGFVKDGKNINYYDDKDLIKTVSPFIISSIVAQLEIGFATNTCYCIGEGKNYKFLSGLNEKYKWFKKITPLPHPRFIMQYKRKEKEKYIRQYIDVLLTEQA